jgi:LPS-assembly protein
MPPLMLRPNPIWLAILCGALAPLARAADQSCSSPTVPSLLPQQPPAATQKPKGEKSVATGGLISVDADHSDYNVNTDTAIFTGHVVIRQGDRELKADQVQIDTKKNVKGQGGVDYTDPIVHILGAGGNYSPSGGADFKDAQFQLLQRPARGSAQTMSLTPEGILRLEEVTFTTCPANDKSWSLDASDITLDTRAKEGKARDATIHFKSVPILYLPWVSFPLGDERKSGFLYPTPGYTSRGGVVLAVPYYWNIAPNMDFTAEPIYYTRRGIDLGGDFRYLEPGSHGELSWHFLPNDTVFNNGTRSDVRFRNTTDLIDNLRLTVDAENASDTQYFQDFSQGPEGTSTAFVERRATLSYRDDHWRVDGEAQQYQTIDNTLARTNLPYARVPSLTASADYGWGPESLVRYGFDSEFVNFDRNVRRYTDCSAPGLLVSPCVTGWRMDVMPAVSLNLEDPGYFLRPALAYRATQYELENTSPGEDSSPSRTLPIASLDTGLQFESDLGATGKRKLTLEPRVLYLYVPYRNQNALPVFDTALPDLVPVELFRTNRYVGGDRVSDANQVATGLSSRLLDGRDGRQFIAVTIGQIYYFTTPRVVLPYEVPQTGVHSDFVTQLAINAFQDWNSNIGLLWNPQASEFDRADVNIQYKPAADKVINLAYRFERGTIHPASQCNIIETTATASGTLTAAQYSQAGICGFEQIEISGAWPIVNHWNAFAREVYSLQDKQPLESFVGFEYGSCCWRVRFGARRYISRRPAISNNNPLMPQSAETGPQDTGAWLQLELTGLASVGSASDTFLIDEIRGYTPSEASSKKPLKGP